MGLKANRNSIKDNIFNAVLHSVTMNRFSWLPYQQNSDKSQIKQTAASKIYYVAGILSPMCAVVARGLHSTYNDYGVAHQVSTFIYQCQCVRHMPCLICDSYSHKVGVRIF